MSKAQEILKSIDQATAPEETLVVASQQECERQWDDLENETFDVTEMKTDHGEDYYVGSWVQDQIRMNLIAEPRIEEGGPNLFLEIGQNPMVKYSYKGMNFQHRGEIYPEFKKVARRVKMNGLSGVDLSNDWNVVEY
jgi:hypothetical protein